MADLFTTHRDTLEKALDACAKRYAWTAYPESPSSRIHGKELPARGKQAFEDLLNKPFPLQLPGQTGTNGVEISPFTREPLGVEYPSVDVEQTITAAQTAWPAWRDASVQQRMGVCLEMLDRCGQAEALFINAHATMHTAGQSFIMAFAGCGANALDRGLEALAYAWKAMQDVPASAEWQRSFGGPEEIKLHKRYRLMPRGISVAVTCATFPQWNGYPAAMASLATGNPLIFKPHPNAVLPVALCVKIFREVLSDADFDPNLVAMVTDTPAQSLTVALLQHPATAIIDFTGSPQFGTWIEQNCRQALVYTETAGCNSVLVESTDNLPGMARAIAHSLCQASAQMCTSVQNIFVPADGIAVNGERVTFDAVKTAIVDAVDDHLSDTKQAAFLCGALVNDGVEQLVAKMREAGRQQGTILRDSTTYQHPDFTNPRTGTPLIIELDATAHELYGEERFGPVSFIIRSDSAAAALQQATADVRARGAITSHIYSVDADFLATAQDAYQIAGASVACNLIGMPINFAAAYSDYHVTGLTAAGNACLTDLAFVAGRFRIVQSKWPEA